MSTQNGDTGALKTKFITSKLGKRKKETTSNLRVENREASRWILKLV